MRKLSRWPCAHLPPSSDPSKDGRGLPSLVIFCHEEGKPTSSRFLVQWETLASLVFGNGETSRCGQLGLSWPESLPRWAYTGFVFQDNPKKTAESERGDFYITGDRAHMDTEGYFWFLGRNDDVINSSRSSCLLFPPPSKASWERGRVLEDFVLLFQLPDRAR